MKFKLNGSSVEFVVINIILSFADVMTLGILLPYHLLWNVRFFISNTEVIDEKKLSK